MINEERVILMTKMTSYEKGVGKKNIAIGKYFKGDYVGFQILKSIISVTISFLLIFCVYIFYHFEVVMLEIYKMDLVNIVKGMVILYLIISGVYGMFSYVLSAYQYDRAKKSLRVYYGNLRKLSQMYEDK